MIKNAGFIMAKDGENMLFDSPSPIIMAFGPCWAPLDLNHSFLLTLD
jgi:hypothetical protein